MSHDPVILLVQIQDVFKFKEENMEKPKIYLGEKVVKMILDRAEGWYMSAEKYVRVAVEKVEKISQNITNACQLVARPHHV